MAMEALSQSKGEVVLGDVDDSEEILVIYIIKADQTSYINYIKPLILAEELEIPHKVSVIDSTEQWYYKVHPERYVPALRDRDPVTGQTCHVFESTACLQYIAARFDRDGEWTGRTMWEKAQVMSWTEYQTAGIGPTAKYWLYFSKGYPSRQNPEPLPKTIAQLHLNTRKQWDVLEKRLSLPDQAYVAVPGRPTLADISYLPFAMPWMFRFFGVDINDWPNVSAWAERMLNRPAVAAILERGPKYGH